MCDYVWLNVAYNYEWLLKSLFKKFGWILVLFSISCDYDLFHLSNRLIFHDVFVFFTTLFIHLVALTTKNSHIICIRYVCYLVATCINYLIVHTCTYMYIVRCLLSTCILPTYLAIY
jgi:hypothetical protein